MSTDTPAPRRSQREKKQAKLFTSVESSLKKRKRAPNDNEDNSIHESEPEEIQVSSDEADEGDVEDYETSKHSKKTSTTRRQGKGKAAPKPKGSLAKKPRVAKAPTQKAAKVHKATGRKPRKAKEDGDTFDAAQVAKDTRISDDNPLFNAIMNPAAALQSTAEDFLESLSQMPGVALAELINLILRSCGCNDSVDGDEVLDYDGVVDTLDNFTEGLKQDNSPVYPLTSKLPVFKRFRRSISEFLERLISSSAALRYLYTTDLMSTLQTWVIAMSSSQIRSFRHTATVVALEVETALCDVAAKVEKEAEVVGRQREGERKRKATNKGAGARDKQLEGKAAEVRERRTKLAEFLKEIVDGVFVHRYRDLDPAIRAECVRSIGLWFVKYPGHFLDGAYLRYVGWVLSDSATQVRLEAVKALTGVYEQADYIGSLNHFTERFKPRLIEMATSDTELSVRVAVIQVLEAIDGHSLLEDEEREKLCLLIFDQEAKVRRSVNGFIKGVWADTTDERLVGRSRISQNDKNRAGFKALAMLLVEWGKILDDIAKGSGEGDDATFGDEAIKDDDSSRSASKEVADLAIHVPQGRVALAVEALWEHVDPVSDWEGLLDVLLLDHSAAGDDESQAGHDPRTNGGSSDDQDSVVDEAWRLDEVEEGVLLEVLVAALERAKAQVSGSKKDEEETVGNDITRALIKGLPRLFIKHQTDQNRLATVLLIPQLMNLDLYLEMRMVTNYAGLWDDVTKQFLSQSSMKVLTHAVGTIRHLMDATSLSNMNSTKILELEDELSTLLRDAVAGRDEIEIASLTEDEVLTLGALCKRLAVLSGSRDMTAWTEEDEGGKQSSAWDIISALSERGRLGYKEEETMVEQALRFLTLHIIWKSKELTSSLDPTSEETRFKEVLCTQRESLLEKLTEYAIGTQSNTAEGVKRVSFQNLLHLHVLFSSAQGFAADGTPLPTATLALALDDEMQYRCAGFVQAEIQHYADSLGRTAIHIDSASVSGDDSESGADADDSGKGQKTKPRQERQSYKSDLVSRSQLEQEYVFLDVMSTFLRAIRAGAIHIRHGATLLTHYDQLGPSFDVCCKVVAEVLREEGMFNDNGDIVVSVIVQAIQEAFSLVLDSVVRDESHAVALSKLLASCFILRGSQLSIIRRLDSKYVVRVQTTLLTWIGKKLAAYAANKNQRGLKIAISFFRVLHPLVGPLQSRDALKIKAHMDQVLAQGNVAISPTSRIWEPQRVYEKRLTTVMSKEKGAGAAKGRKPKAKKDLNTPMSTDESDGENLADGPSPSLPQAEPKPPVVPDRGLSSEPGTTPPRTLLPSLEDRSSPMQSHSHDEPNGMSTPIVSRKRPRSEKAGENQQSNNGDATSPNQETSPPTPTNDIRIKKRIRH